MKNSAPKHLTAEARRLWSRLREDFVLDDEAALLVLRALCEAFDRAQMARAEVARDGATVRDRWGQIKAHPAVAIERDARGQVLAAVRALKLAPGDVV